MIRVAIAEDQVLFRRGLEDMINEQPDMQIVIAAGDGAELLHQLSNTAVDVVLMDIDMPRLNGLAATAEIASLQLDTKVVVLTMHVTNSLILQMVDLGAAGYLDKNSEPEDLIAAIRQVHYNGFYFNELLNSETLRSRIRHLIASVPRYASNVNVPVLTEREREVLMLICQELSTKEIADKLFISEPTVKTHRSNIMEKLQVKNVAGMVLYAVRIGMIK